MKAIAHITVMCLFIFGLNAQHDHSIIEHLFENKSLADFEFQIGLTPEDYSNSLLVNFVDKKYQDLHDKMELKIENGTVLHPLKFEMTYSKLIESVKNEIASFKPAQGQLGSPKMADGPCVNMDFETGGFAGWTLTRGDVTGAMPYSYMGEFLTAPGPYHTIFGGGVDPVCGIPRVNPQGGTFSARLGNGTGVGARAARLKQTFLVDPTNYMFIYSYAVIFESPAGHTQNQLPYFTVRVFDSLGNSIPCGEYSVIADAANTPDYQTTTSGGSTVLYKNWESVFTNLSAYIGQNVTVEFTSGDCSLTGHFGYAYVDASCGIDQLTASNNIICNGDSSILSAPAGASSYLWSNGATTQSTTVYSGGTYSCTITPFQGGGCDITLDVTITENPMPLANFSNVTGTCVGSPVDFNSLSTIPNPGAITAYQWDFGDGTVTPLTYGTIIAVSNTTGTYTSPSHTYANSGIYNVQLMIESADGCRDSITLPVIVLGLPAVVAGLDQEVCDGESITLEGMGAASYSWDNGVINGVPFVPTLGTTIYTVTGTDMNGCMDTDQIEVTVNTLPNVDAGPDQSICAGTSVSLSASGAVSYDWNNGVIDGVPFVVANGTTIYSVTGIDLNGCVNTDEVSVIEIPLPLVSAGQDQSVCDGESVTLVGSGIPGAGVGTYVWNNGIVNGVPFFPSVGTTTYTVTGTDINGCVNDDQVDITVNPLPNVNGGLNQSVCDGESLVLTAIGAVSYSWDNGVLDGVPFYPLVGTTTYTVTGIDANGCIDSDQVDIIVNPLPNIDAGPDQEVCKKEQVILTGSGSGVLSWDNGVINGVPFVQGVGTVIYTVTGTDGNGCINTDQVIVVVNPLPLINAGQDQQLCEGTSVTLSALGSPALYWNNGVFNNIPFIQEPGIINYVVHDSLATGCTATDTVVVEVFPNPLVTTNDVEICEGEGAILEGEGAITYSWSNGVINGVEFFPSITSTYLVLGTDHNGCIGNADATVRVYNAPIVDFNILSLSLTSINPTTGFDNLTTGASTYQWNFGDGSAYSYEFEPVHTFPLDESGEYTITLTAESEFGCPAEAVKFLHVFPDYSIYVPNTFTPDGNGANEIFMPILRGFDKDEYTLYIFNRWGDLIFESHNMEVGWDGTFAGQNFQVQDGVYTWKILAGLKDSSDSKIFVGHVSILK